MRPHWRPETDCNVQLKPKRGPNRRWEPTRATGVTPDFPDPDVRFDYTGLRMRNAWYTPMWVAIPVGCRGGNLYVEGDLFTFGYLMLYDYLPS